MPDIGEEGTSDVPLLLHEQATPGRGSETATNGSLKALLTTAALLLLAAGLAGLAVTQLAPAASGGESANLAEHTLFRPGTIPLDDQGREVHAHGGQLIRDGNTYYWLGTSQKLPPAWTSTHINLYSSPDLAHWKHAGVLLSWEQIKGFPDLLPYGHLDAPPPPLRIERPKMLYHKADRKWVMMFHLDTPAFEVPAVGVATAERITGPFSWRGHFFPDNNTSYDMTLYEDEETGQAFLVRSCPVMTIAVSRLRPDWLATEDAGVCSTTGHGSEAPAVFKSQGRHYILASHLTGWAPNPPLLYQSTAGGMCSTFWRDLPRPSHGPAADTAYQSQATHVHPFRFADGSELLLYQGDRWNADGPGSVGGASYVWLPLLPRLGAEGFELVWEPAWSLRQFKGAAFDSAAQQIVFADGSRRAAAQWPQRQAQRSKGGAAQGSGDSSGKLRQWPVWGPNVGGARGGQQEHS